MNAERSFAFLHAKPMLLILTELKPSEIHGIGLFATAPIKSGTRVWQYNPKIDRRISPSFLYTIPQCAAEQVRKYSYVKPDYQEVMVLCGDDARHMNFPAAGETANIGLGVELDSEYTLVAVRDIQKGEELTVCGESDADAARKLSSQGKLQFDQMEFDKADTKR